MFADFGGIDRVVQLGTDASPVSIDGMAAAAVHPKLRKTPHGILGGADRRLHRRKTIPGPDQVDADELIGPAVVALLANLFVLDVLPHQVVRPELDALPGSGLELEEGEAVHPAAIERQPRLVLENTRDGHCRLVTVAAGEEQLLLAAPVAAVDEIEHLVEAERVEDDLVAFVWIEDPDLPGADPLLEHRETALGDRLRTPGEDQATRRLRSRRRRCQDGQTNEPSECAARRASRPSIQA